MSSKHFFLEHFTGVASNDILFETILRNCILTRHSFGATFWSCIPTLSLWGNFTELYSQNISFEEILQNCILKIFPSRQLSGVVFPQNISFEATLRSCIFLKHIIWGNSVKLYSQNISLWGNSAELYSHTSFWGNSPELYSQNISFEATLRSSILKTLPLRQIY